MKKLLFIPLLFVAFIAASQITILENPTKKAASETEILKYDSLSNFKLVNPLSLVGQELYLIPRPETSKKYGYQNFNSTIYADRFDKPYKCCATASEFSTNHDVIAGTYFTVLSVKTHPKIDEYLYRDNYYFELSDNKTGDKCFYLADFKYEKIWPFLILGFKVKNENKNAGKRYFYLKNEVENSEIDILTGVEIKYKSDRKWLFKEVIVCNPSKYWGNVPCILLTSDDGYNIAVNQTDLLNVIPRNAFQDFEYEAYLEKFGKEYMDAVLNNSVVIGMSEMLCRWSWGEPEKINRTINENGSLEQWVYKSGKYLYFKEGKLVTIQ